MLYRWLGEETQEMTIYSDTDWGGCRKTRRSTSGGLILRGPHYIRSWSNTQATVALSSAEAELGGIVKASAEGIGIRNIGRDLGDAVPKHITVYSDAAAALGIVARRGVGRIRHLDTRLLWVQENNVRRGVEYSKIRGNENPSDPLTKHTGEEGIAQMLAWADMEWRD